MAYGVTASDVRLVVGIGSSDVSDANMSIIITNAEYEVDRLLNTTSTPKRVIERYVTPNSPSFLMLRRTPVTRVANIMVGGTGGTWVDPSKTILRPVTGQLLLTNSAQKTLFDDDDIKGNIIDYYYGNLEESTTETTLSATTGTGAATVITVASSSGLSADDYVKLESYIDESEETTKVISVGTGTFTADLSWDHFSGGRVIKMQVPNMVKEMTRIISGIMTCLNMIGSTYTFATSYSIPEMSVTKGVPYPHFDRLLASLVKKRDYILMRLRPQSVVY